MIIRLQKCFYGKQNRSTTAVFNQENYKSFKKQRLPSSIQAVSQPAQCVGGRDTSHSGTINKIITLNG